MHSIVDQMQSARGAGKEELLAVGRCRAPHGLKGFIKVLSFSGEFQHFLEFESVTIKKPGELRGSQYRVEEVRPTASNLLVKLSGISSPEAAAELIGAEIWVDRSRASRLNVGEFYAADLCRCIVFHHGIQIGRVRSILEGSAADFLEVQGPNGTACIVPFIHQFVGDVDISSYRIELKEDFEIP